VFTGTVRSWSKDGGVGKLVARDCLFLRGEVRTKHGMDLKNCLVSGIVHAYAPGGALIHQCTLTQLAHLDGAPNVVSDSIVSCVESTQPANVHHSDVFDKGFLLLAKQGEGCFKADPQFNDPKEFDFGLKKTSPCIGKASDGGDIGCRYTPEMLEMLKKALELRKKGIIKF